MREKTLDYPDPPLTDGVVLLRQWKEDDLSCVEDASQDPVIPEGTTVPSLYSAPEGRAWIERQWGRLTNGEGVSLAIVDARSGEALGLAVLLFRSQHGVAGVGYWVISRARGRGLGSRALHLLSRWGLLSVGLARIEALVEPENKASRRMLEKAGFLEEGLLRSALSFDSRRADAVIYSLIPKDLTTGK